MYAVFLFGTASRKTSLVFVLLVPVLPPEMAVLGFFVTVTSAVVLFTFCLPTEMVAAGMVNVPSFIALR